jgi:hypothetical protein
LLFTNKWENWKKPLHIVHSIILSLLWVALIILLTVLFKTIPIYVSIIAGCCFAFHILLVFAKNLGFPKLLAICFFTTIGLNIFLNTAIYPSLLKYQTGSVAAGFINDHKLPKENVLSMEM